MNSGKSTQFVIATLVLVPVLIHYLRKKKLNKTLLTPPAEIEKLPIREYFLRLPGYTVAAVIGRRGSMLRTIMHETQTECVVVSYTKDQLERLDDLSAEEYTGWKSYENATDGWFEDDKREEIEKITYLIVRTDDPKKFELVRLKIVELAAILRKSLKTREFLVDSEHIGFIVGRGGKNVRNICANYNVKINLSAPLSSDPSKAVVTLHGRDIASLSKAEIVIRETGVPKKLDHVPKYDEQPLRSGIYQDIVEELDELRKIGEQLSGSAL